MHTPGVRHLLRFQKQFAASTPDINHFAWFAAVHGIFASVVDGARINDGAVVFRRPIPKFADRPLQGFAQFGQAVLYARWPTASPK